MSEPKYRDWILETIDSLRSRKARPDLERICRMVRRRHGSDPDRTRAELEKLIQEQTVLKVSYKGSISYRNAAKVQRKSRKKNEFTPGGSAEAASERGKHVSVNNNGDSAHSFSDPEEDESGDKEDFEPTPSPDLRPQTTAIKPGAEQKTSGNGCLSCGATGCAAGSGCVGKASTARDKRLGQAGGGIPSHEHETNTPDAHSVPSKTTVDREGGKPGNSSGAERENQTCLPIRQQQPAALKTKLRAVGGAKGGQDNTDLGDRLVASVRSLAERNRGSATTRGHKPLGLKEILGYLSGQERLSAEKLTRSKVKVVLEREVARGRLRRTRCGNITLPLRVTEEETVAKPPATRPPKNALQEKHVVKKPMKEEGVSDEEEEEESGARQDEEGHGPGHPQTLGVDVDPSVTMETAAGRRDDITGGSEAPAPMSDEGVKQEDTLQPCSKGELEAGPQSRAVFPSAQRGVAPGCESMCVEESAVTPDQLQSDGQSEGGSHTSSDLNSCEVEVGVSSCLLTPTSSPRDPRPDPALSEERGMHGGMNGGMNGGVERTEGSRRVSLLQWSVSDVVRYITQAGFPEQALAFRTQEIDGKSLLLMQRNDVLTGLSIRLGPALKIYERHVKVLQRTHFEEDEEC